MKFEELEKIKPGATPEKLNEVFNKNTEALNFFLPALAAEINKLSKQLKTKQT